ncbi:MAG: hypothetical protein AVDCRST_MAG96-2351 [uncultured Segetibacter sp.]|uniref:Uncharacterized protein n=1 Tax=uncultured Segetibacter sp. TaxID=481133 RepID=A0A6J4SYV4_9BACT|nr:MAG: hypothetical protein AVDCRST_MAG96-2351 [uncultured Segetibacter sp.]
MIAHTFSEFYGSCISFILIIKLFKVAAKDKLFYYRVR